MAAKARRCISLLFLLSAAVFVTKLIVFKSLRSTTLPDLTTSQTPCPWTVCGPRRDTRGPIYRISGDTPRNVTDIVSIYGDDIDLTKFSEIIRGGEVDLEGLAKYRMMGLWLTEREKMLMTEALPNDTASVASHETSSVHVLQGPTPEQPSVGDTVVVRVDLKDRLGRHVHQGGASVRVWMTGDPRPSGPEADPQQGKQPPGVAAAAEVEDLRNGSYLAKLPVLWTGKVHIVAALQQPRELQRLYLALLDKAKMLRLIAGRFQQGSSEQITLCMPIPVVPGYPQVCNLTSLNDGMPWYCGMPTKRNISCSDWKSTRVAVDTSFLAVTSTESEFLRQFRTKQSTIYRIPQTVTISAAAGEIPASGSSCFDRPPRDSWNDQSPRGYWQRDTWHSLTCVPPALQTSLTDQCLRNTTVVIIGDSNSRQVLQVLQQVSKCTERLLYPPDVAIRDLNVLHVPRHCHKKNVSLDMYWHPHAYPFLSNLRWSQRQGKRAPGRVLDQIPSSGNFVVLIHLYLHFPLVHSDVYGQYVRSTVHSVRDLLQRNPNVKVFVMGPHAVGTSTGVVADYTPLMFLRILKKEFRNLADRVVLLNPWDMTVACENLTFHPDFYVTRAVLRLLLGHMCPPDKSS